jgi:hypothetical protein
MATHYHVFVLEALLLVAWLERAHAAPVRGLEQVIARMAAYLDAITLRSGAVVDHGDHDDGVVISLFRPRHAEQLLGAARALTEPPGEAAIGDGARLLCDGAPCARGPLPTRSRWFHDSGQVVLRSARLHATFDAGPFGFGALAAHAHCDALAVSVAIDDRPLFVERGTYRYHGDRAARDHYRSTAMHNTVQVGAREQGEIAGPFLWSRKPVATIEHCALADARDVVRASHDGFAPARHVRTLIRIDDALAVIDDVRGASEPATARWHLAPEVSIVEIAADGFVIVRDARAERWLWFGHDDHPLRARAITTPHSPRYLAQQPASTLELDLPRAKLVTIIATDAGAVHRVLAAVRSAP